MKDLSSCNTQNDFRQLTLVSFHKSFVSIDLPLWDSVGRNFDIRMQVLNNLVIVQ